jgi:hypothetical protein
MRGARIQRAATPSRRAAESPTIGAPDFAYDRLTAKWDPGACRVTFDLEIHDSELPGTIDSQNISIGVRCTLAMQGKEGNWSGTWSCTRLLDGKGIPSLRS